MLSYEKLDEICTKNGYILVCYHPLELEDSDGYIIKGNTAKNIVDFLEQKHGSYVGKQYYTQQEIVFDVDIPKPSCLDSAYERKAIDDNVNNTPVFPENILYLKHKRGEL